MPALELRLEGGPTLTLSAKAGAAITVEDGTLRFDVGDEAAYVSTAGGAVTRPPDQRLALTPRATYRLTLDYACAGEVVAWIVEFAGTEKVAQRSRRLEGTRLALTWSADARAEHALIALRVRGQGSLRITRARLAELAPALDDTALAGDDAPVRAVAPLALDPRFDPDHAFAELQLELLWQKGLLNAVDLRGGAPAPRIAAWLDRRKIPTWSPGADVSLVGPRRAQALAHPERLLFPPVPETADDCRAQGFVIVGPDELPDSEFSDAKTFWKDYGVRSWYQVDKPWTGWLARWVRDTGAKRVLEFGCNVGRNLAGIRDLCPGVELVGIDLNAEAIAAGRAHHGLDLRVADERGLAAFADGEFDAVFTVSVLDHMSEIGAVCRELIRVTSRHALFFEVRLPIEGRVVEHFDHKAGAVKRSTGASYSWHVERHLPPVAALEILPTYLHSASLGPYYAAYFATVAR